MSTEHQETRKKTNKQVHQVQPMQIEEPVDLEALERKVDSSTPLLPGEGAFLQRTIGNRATGKLLGIQSTDSTNRGASNRSLDAIMRRIERLGVQAKLTVGPVDDPYEKEADTVSQQVVKQINRQDEEELSLKREDIQAVDTDLDSPIRSVQSLGRSSDPSSIQRVITPDFPADALDKDKTALKRNYLRVLRSQLLTTKGVDDLKKGIYLDQIDLMIQFPENKVLNSDEEFQKLIAEVNALTPDAKNTGGAANLQPLTGNEQTQLNKIFAEADKHCTALRGDADLIKEIFGPIQQTGLFGGFWDPELGDTAMANIAKIQEHLKGQWRNPDNVRINRKENPGYIAYNQGSKANSNLVLSKDFLQKGDPIDRAGTLVHEASHGIVGTKDHGYMGASYFYQLNKDELALDNADHYKYGFLRAAGVMQAPQAVNNQANPDLDKFARAKTLSYFKANQTWIFVKWLNATYAKAGEYVSAGAMKEHARLMGLDVDADGFKEDTYGAIRQANAIVLEELYSAVKAYLIKDTDLVLTLDQKGVVMKPKGGGPEITVDNVVGQSTDEQSKLILKAMAALYGLPDSDDWDLTVLGEGMFDFLWKTEKQHQLTDPMSGKLKTILSQ